MVYSLSAVMILDEAMVGVVVRCRRVACLGIGRILCGELRRIAEINELFFTVRDRSILHVDTET